MIKLLSLFVFVCFSLMSSAQTLDSNKIKGNTIPAEQEESIFIYTEEIPQFPGGEQAQMRFMSENIRYPEFERDSGIQGLVVASFIIEKDGRITDIKILKGVTPDIDKEVIRVLKKMPRWSPGKQKGKAVRVRINLPVRFTLN
ncbi:MAG: energy transducer TonB [Bacteroidetes bacterium]|nr:energy transducer TonB [Bacteroidota bacterium]MBT4969456.1 energy transducer TonB [Bacteroidota bacterium]